MAIRMHAGGVDFQDDRIAATGTDLAGGLIVRAQMNVMAFAPPQTLGPNPIQELLHGSVKEEGRGLGRRIIQVQGQAMSLGGADAFAVGAEDEAPLVIPGDQSAQLSKCQSVAVTVERIQ